MRTKKYISSLFILILYSFSVSGLWFDETSGEYRGLVVKIDRRTSTDDCGNTLHNLMDVLRETSLSIGRATAWRIWAAQYIIVLPSASWTECLKATLDRPEGQLRFKKADILVEPAGTLADGGTMVRTQQSGGCGMPGDHVTLPLPFIQGNLTSLSTRGKLVAHQIFKLRYGIFDEVGFPGDLLYPSHYREDGNTPRIMATGSANLPVRGTWIQRDGQTPCNPQQEFCFFQLEDRNAGISCSLGSYASLPCVEKYCRPQEDPRYNSAPTKQNVLCGGLTAHEMLETSLDLAQVPDDLYNMSSRLEVNLDPTIHLPIPDFNFVLEPPNKYVLVMESSLSMGINDDWKWIQKAAHKLIRYDLPDNLEVGVVSFSLKSRMEFPLTVLNNARGRVADSVPDKYRLSKDNGRCVICGITTALEVLGEEKAGGHIILVTRGGQDTLSTTDETKILDMVEQYQIKVSSILVELSGTPPHHAFYDQLASESGGQTFLIPARDREGQPPTGIHKYSNIIAALQTLTEEDSKEIILHRKKHSVDSIKESRGQFRVDGGLTSVQFGVLVEDEEDHLIRSVSFVSESGVTYGPFHRLATTFDNINIKTVNYGFEEPPPFGQEDSLWEYIVNWHPTVRRKRAVSTSPQSNSQDARRLSSLPSAVILVSASTMNSTDPDANIEVKFWTSRDQQERKVVTTGPNQKYPKPLAMFVSVRRGIYPVLRASVTVDVQVSSGESATNGQTTVHRLAAVQLLDNGSTQPDMVAGDGIYSRYLTNYTYAGRFTFVVTVNDNDEKAVYLPSQDEPTTDDEYRFDAVSAELSGPSRCCGSVVQLSEADSVRLQQTGKFQRRVDWGGALEIKGVNDFLANYLFPGDSNDTNGSLAPLEDRNANGNITASLVEQMTARNASKLQPVPFTDAILFDSSSVDWMPPGKIVDLQLSVEPNTLSYLASWTAPADNYDDTASGHVNSYRLIFAQSYSALLNLHNIESIIPNDRLMTRSNRAERIQESPASETDPKFVIQTITLSGDNSTTVDATAIGQPGSLITHRIPFSLDNLYFDADLTAALVAVDRAGNLGLLSNLVTGLVMPKPVVPGSDNPLWGSDAALGGSISVTSASNDGTAANSWTMIGALCGGILLLGLLLLLGVLYFLRVARPARKGIASSSGGSLQSTGHQGGGNGAVGGDQTDASSCSSDSKNTSSHRLMPDITTVAGSLPVFQAPPASLPDSTPTYWSATQLLTEHEQRALNLSYSAINRPYSPPDSVGSSQYHQLPHSGQMETIREEQYIGYPEEYPPRRDQEDEEDNSLASHQSVRSATALMMLANGIHRRRSNETSAQQDGVGSPADGITNPAFNVTNNNNRRLSTGDNNNEGGSASGSLMTSSAGFFQARPGGKDQYNVIPRRRFFSQEHLNSDLIAGYPGCCDQLASNGGNQQARLSVLNTSAGGGLADSSLNSSSGGVHPADSVISVGSTLFRTTMGGAEGDLNTSSDGPDNAVNGGQTPEQILRYSTAVQTMAPSTIARLRQQNGPPGPSSAAFSGQQSLTRTRNVSLV